MSDSVPTQAQAIQETWWTRLRGRVRRLDLSRRGMSRRLALLACRFIAWQDTSNYRTHALRELQVAGYDLNEPTGPNRWIIDDILQLLAVLSLQGHSGSSIGYCVKSFAKLGMFEPLAPLTGADDEWNECGTNTWQNNRCSHVFKEADGRAYDIDGRIFREPSGSCFTSRDSRVYVTFPYVPTREYVDVPTQ